MFVLHIELAVKPGLQHALENTYLADFRPAISAQEGFEAVQLLHSNDNDASYRLCLTFDRQASQQKWVATDLHQQVWPAIESRCEKFSVAGYSAV
jgi:heme-degrading monooxygenase HmoA